MHLFFPQIQIKVRAQCRAARGLFAGFLFLMTLTAHHCAQRGEGRLEEKGRLPKRKLPAFIQKECSKKKKKQKRKKKKFGFGVSDVGLRFQRISRGAADEIRSVSPLEKHQRCDKTRDATPTYLRAKNTAEVKLQATCH